MSTKVIDKLRIQGNAAPRQSRGIQDTFHHPAFHDADAPSQFVYQADAGSSVNSNGDVTTGVNSHPSSAASRRLDHLQRVQQANRGLTSAEFSAMGREGLPTIHFLIRGKPVQNDTERKKSDVFNHQRVGHYKTSAKEVYRARHKIQTELPPGGDQSKVFRAIRAPPHDVEMTSGQANATNHFYLGPVGGGQTPSHTWLAKRGVSDLTSSGHSIFKRSSHKESSSLNNNNSLPWYESKTNSRDEGNDFTLAGQPLPTPNGSPQGDSYMDAGDFHFGTYATQSFNEINSVPNPTGISPRSAPIASRQRQVSTWSRRGLREPSKSQSDFSSLKQCLRVHPSYKLPPQQDMSPREIVHLKHCPQAKVNYNNPYRNMRSKERKNDSLSNAGRYVFNSVESYIHFNKIYPRAAGTQSQHGLSLGSREGMTGGLPNIPRVNGFTSHCTDTVLLKMMFEMNKPKSGRSINKYSDVAVHKDLEEFMIVSTSTVSRPPSVSSRKTPAGLKSKSQVSVSFESKHEKEDEEKRIGAERGESVQTTESRCEEQQLKIDEEVKAESETKETNEQVNE